MVTAVVAELQDRFEWIQPRLLRTLAETQTPDQRRTKDMVAGMLPGPLGQIEEVPPSERLAVLVDRDRGEHALAVAFGRHG